MTIKQLEVGGFDHNFSYFVYGDNHDFLVADPAGSVLDFVGEEVQQGGVLRGVIITHSHFDHVEKLPQLLKEHDVPVYIHRNAANRLSDISSDNLRLLSEGDVVEVGDSELYVMHTPGHIDDAICFHDQGGKQQLVTGDTLFVEGCGRADLNGSNVKDLYNSLQRIKGLEDSTLVYPGHNYGSKSVSDLAWEKKHNQYLKCETYEEFRLLRME